MQSERLTRAIRSTATALVLAALAGCAHLPDQPAYAPADRAARYAATFDAARVGRVDILRALHDAGYPSMPPTAVALRP